MVATKNNNILWLRTLLALTPSPAPPLSLFRRIIWWPFPTSTRRKSQTITGQNICYFCQEIERNLMTSFNTYVTLLHLWGNYICCCWNIVNSKYYLILTQKYAFICTICMFDNSKIINFVLILGIANIALSGNQQPSLVLQSANICWQRISQGFH